MRDNNKRYYDFGGFMKDVGMGMLDAGGVGMVTRLATGETMSDLTGYEYNNDFISKYADIAGDMGYKSLPMAANILAPGTGALVAGAQQASAIAHQDKLAKKNIDNNSGPQLMMNGGNMNMGQSQVAPENTIAEYEGLTHDSGGIPINDKVEVEDGEFKYKDMIFTNRF